MPTDSAFPERGHSGPPLRFASRSDTPTDEPDVRPPVDDPPDDDAATLTPDAVFGLLSNRRRRLVVRYLRAHGSTTVGDLAEHVAGLEHDVPPAELSSDQRKRVYISLYQSHLPKLADDDVVEYDSDRGTVAAGPAAPTLYPYLDDTPRVRRESPSQSDSRPAWPALAGSFVTAVVVAGLIGVPPLNALSPVVLAAVATVALTGLVAHVAREAGD